MELMLLVRCPHEDCRATRKTESVGTVECFSCGKKYKVFDKKNGRSNVVSILKGNKELLTRTLYQRGIYGKRNTKKAK